MIGVITYRDEYKIPSKFDFRVQMGLFYIKDTSKEVVTFKTYADRILLVIDKNSDQIIFECKDFKEVMDELLFLHKIVKEKLSEIQLINENYNWNDALHLTLTDLPFIRDKKIQFILD